MALTGAKDIAAEAQEARKSIPLKYLASSEASLQAKFEMSDIDADCDGFLNPQELRNLAARLMKMETEEDLRAALSGVLSGRLLEGFFKHRDEALQKAAKEERKARQDMYYLALLQAQIDQLKWDIQGLTKEIDGIESDFFTKEEMATFDAMPEDQQFAAKDAAMRQKVIDGDMSEAEYQRWKMLNEQRASKQQQLEQSQDNFKQEMAKFKATGQDFEKDSTDRTLTDLRRENTSIAKDIREEELEIFDLEGLKNSHEEGSLNEVDRFLEAAGSAAQVKMLEDPKVAPEIKDRIQVVQLKEILKEIERDLGGTPDLIIEVRGVIEGAPENIREALLQEDGLSPEILNAMYKSHAETLDPDSKAPRVTEDVGDLRNTGGNPTPSLG